MRTTAFYTSVLQPAVLLAAGATSACTDDARGPAADEAGAPDGSRSIDSNTEAGSELRDGAASQRRPDGDAFIADGGPERRDATENLPRDGGAHDAMNRPREAGGGQLDANASDRDGGKTCAVPSAPTFDIVHRGATIEFSVPAGMEVEVGWSDDSSAGEPDHWEETRSYDFASDGTPYAVKLFARVRGASCRFEHVYHVRDGYPPAAGEAGSDAVGKDDASIVGWAETYAKPVHYGSDVDSTWQTPEKALGAATGDSLDVVGLGNGGRIVLVFDPPITNGAGPDFVVFENSFNDVFLELAFVEVSSDGIHFERFDSAYVNPTPVPAYGTHEPVHIHGLAGKYRSGFGTPFDLESLRYRPRLRDGSVDPMRISHVRIVDIVGDGSEHDSFGNPIYDPTPTSGSGGFDLEAVGVLNAGE